jgi:hypothetical protein
MPKKAVFQDPLAEDDQQHLILANLLKNIATQPQQKPKQKRQISEERREQLREQLKKGREKSIASRGAKAKAKVAEAQEMQTITPPAPVTKEPAQSGDVSKLETKFDVLISHMKDMNGMQKEILEHKKSKIAKKEEAKAPKKEDDNEWLFGNKETPTKPPPSKPIPIPAPAPAQPTIPSYYYVPYPKNNLL